jgi:signal transduction histidine kinase/FixJ family two-component response regulator
MTKQPKEKIMVVESDPFASDLIARQALSSLGLQVQIVEDASTAIMQAVTFKPDVIIANLELPGLSGKDLLAALSAQNISVPVIMIAEKGQEGDVIQAFRLGASDYVSSPIREAEVVSAVERALKTVRAHQERENLSRQLQRTNEELQKRVNELTTIFGVGKAVTSITDQNILFDEIIKGAVNLTLADYGWLLVQDESTKEFLLRAHINLPKSLAAKLGKVWDDGMSSLVSASGETLSIFGDSVQRFKLGFMGKSALVTPVKVQNRVVAILSVMRKKEQMFDRSDQAMVAAISDYASISLVNASLFRALDQRAASLQKAVDLSKGSEKLKDEIIQNVSHELRTPLVAVKGYVDMLVAGDVGINIDDDQQEALLITQDKLDRVVEIVQVMNMMHETATPKQQVSHPLNDIAKKAVQRFQKEGKSKGVKIHAKLLKDPIVVYVDVEQISLVFDALLSNAIKFCDGGGKVTVFLSRTPENYAQITVTDDGIGISKKHIKNLFDRFYQVDGSTTRKFEGLGIGLALAKEIIVAHGGKIWVESKLEQGTSFHFILTPPI